MAKNSLKMGKKALCLIFAFLFSIESFATVVTDNDGAAFITKAEFDSLKNDFMVKLDGYNSNIDNKIENAISSYMSGVKVGATTTETSNITALSWPIKIIDKLKVIEEMNNNKTLAEQQPLWNISLDLWGCMERGGFLLGNNTSLDNYSKTAFYNIGIDHFVPTHYDKIEYYLNGTRSGDFFDVSNLCVRPVLTESTGVLHENIQNVTWDSTSVDGNRGVYTVFVMDGNNNSSGYTWESANNRIKRGSMRNNYSALWSTNNWTWDTSPKLYFDHFADYGTSKVSLTTADKYDYYSGSYIHVGQFGSDFGQTLWSGKYTYTNQSLDRIYNYADTTNNSHFAPVTYNNVLYFTNKKWNRLGPTSDRLNWEARGVRTNDHGVLWLTTPGENLENEYENRSAGRAWYNKALISTQRLRYSFVAPTGASYIHRMAYGIPIFYFSKNAKDVKLIVSIASSTGKTTNKKYLIASKAPINTQMYSDNVEGNMNYIKLKKGTTEARKLELSEGTNEIDVGVLNEKDILYIKVLWNDSNDEMITMERPTIIWTTR